MSQWPHRENLELEKWLWRFSLNQDLRIQSSDITKSKQNAWLKEAFKTFITLNRKFEWETILKNTFIELKLTKKYINAKILTCSKMFLFLKKLISIRFFHTYGVIVFSPIGSDSNHDKAEILKMQLWYCNWKWKCFSSWISIIWRSKAIYHYKLANLI